MAKTSKLARDEQRRELVARHKAKRDQLKAIIRNPKSTEEERAAAYASMRKMPRDSSATRVRNRCAMSGRPRGYLRHFGLSRIALRDMPLSGPIPGVRKASW